jgi:hypothetical protein
MCKVLGAVECPLRGYNDLQGGFEELWSIVARESAEEAEILIGLIQGRIEA